MKLQSLESLFPDVRKNFDRLVFECKSRTGTGWHRVDKEKRMGLGECECPAFQKGGQRLCWHLRRVNDFMACYLAQEVMRQTLDKVKK